jgi:hypothetical protein
VVQFPGILEKGYERAKVMHRYLLNALQCIDRASAVILLALRAERV